MRTSDETKTKVNALFNKTHDKDFGSDKHDQIVVWLYGKLKDKEFLKDFSKTLKPESKVYVEIESPITHVVRRYKGCEEIIAGFADIKVGIKNTRVSISGADQYDVGTGVPIFTGVEAELKGYKLSDEKYRSNLFKEVIQDDYEFIFIEVKTKVNIGETIRQLRYYGNGPWFVCSPDESAKDILIEQGIGFIPYNPT